MNGQRNNVSILKHGMPSIRNPQPANIIQNSKLPKITSVVEVTLLSLGIKNK